MVIWLLLLAVPALLGACGGDGNGNDDTIWTGLSGVVIVIVIVWFVLRGMRKKKGS